MLQSAVEKFPDDCSTLNMRPEEGWIDHFPLFCHFSFPFLPSMALCLQPRGSPLSCLGACLLSGSERLSNPSQPVSGDTRSHLPLAEGLIRNHSGLQYPTPMKPPRKQVVIKVAELYLLVCNISGFLFSFGNLFHSFIATCNQCKAVYFM